MGEGVCAESCAKSLLPGIVALLIEIVDNGPVAVVHANDVIDPQLVFDVLNLVLLQ